MNILDQISLGIMALQNGWANFSHSITFSIIKFLIGIYVIVVLADIILLLIQRGLSGDIRAAQLGMDIPAELVSDGPRKKLAKRWEKIKGKLKTGSEDQYKLAIIEADKLIDSLIFRMGYKDGKNFGERLGKIPPGQIEDISDIKEAHTIRNRVILDEKFKVDRELAAKTLALFEKFLIMHDVIKD